MTARQSNKVVVLRTIFEYRETRFRNLALTQTFYVLWSHPSDESGSKIEKGRREISKTSENSVQNIFRATIQKIQIIIYSMCTI